MRGGFMSGSKVIILDGAGEDGHRGDYAATFRRLFQAAGLGVAFERPSARHLLSRHAIASLMIEDHPGAFFLLALARGMVGLRTVGLLFMPAPCLRPLGLRHRLKRLVLRTLRAFPRSEVLTILPISVEPAMAKIASGGIYDPQLWDLSDIEATTVLSTALSDRALEKAAGRTIVVALGGQTRIKGFDRFGDIWLSSTEIRERFLFVAAGRVDVSLKPLAVRLEAEGALIVDRRLTDAELQSLYSSAELVWACYAPDYDQASGIFGRAVQMGRPVVVRRGSLLERLAAEIDCPAVALRWESPDAMTTDMASDSLPSPRPPPRDLVQKLRDQSLRRLSKALGYDLS